MQVSLSSSTPKPREGWRFRPKRWWDVCQQSDKKEPSGSWVEFVRPSVDASSVWCKKTAAMTKVWQPAKWKCAHCWKINGKPEKLIYCAHFGTMKHKKGREAVPSLCFWVLVYCHSCSPTDTVLQASPTCQSRSNWAHHTAVRPCTPLPKPSSPLDLLFDFAFRNCFILQLLLCAEMPSGSLLERHKFFKHSVAQSQHSSRKQTDCREAIQIWVPGLAPAKSQRVGLNITQIKSRWCQPPSDLVQFKMSQISYGGKLTFTDFIAFIFHVWDSNSCIYIKKIWSCFYQIGVCLWSIFTNYT